jgi:hypothetical protein
MHCGIISWDVVNKLCCLCCACCVCLVTLQKAKEDASHAAKKAAIDLETTADSTKHEAKGFGARLWGRGQVSCSEQVALVATLVQLSKTTTTPSDIWCLCHGNGWWLHSVSDKQVAACS